MKKQRGSELSDQSKRPSRLANMKITPEIEIDILNLRKKGRWGAQRIANHLSRKKMKLSTMTVWRVLKKHQAKVVVKSSTTFNTVRKSPKKGSIECDKNTRWGISVHGHR